MHFVQQLLAADASVAGVNCHRSRGETARDRRGGTRATRPKLARRLVGCDSPVVPGRARASVRTRCRFRQGNDACRPSLGRRRTSRVPTYADSTSDRDDFARLIADSAARGVPGRTCCRRKTTKGCGARVDLTRSASSVSTYRHMKRSILHTFKEIRPARRDGQTTVARHKLSPGLCVACVLFVACSAASSGGNSPRTGSSSFNPQGAATPSAIRAVRW
jgi:hypothetical protein